MIKPSQIWQALHWVSSLRSSLLCTRSHFWSKTPCCFAVYSSHWLFLGLVLLVQSVVSPWSCHPPGLLSLPRHWPHPPVGQSVNQSVPLLLHAEGKQNAERARSWLASAARVQNPWAQSWLGVGLGVNAALRLLWAVSMVAAPSGSSCAGAMAAKSTSAIPGLWGDVAQSQDLSSLLHC